MDHDRRTGLRPGDLARPYGLSSQAIRVYEARGIIPPAERTAGGHRRYTGRHATALAAFVALAPGVGHAVATALVRDAHRGELDALLAGLDRAHARMAGDRVTLDLVADAVAGLPTTAPPADPTGPLTVGGLAHRIGVRPATLRAWERAGILRPVRDRRTGFRTYTPADVRDAHLVAQLRRGGSPLAAIAVVVGELRDQGRHDRLDAALVEWRDALRRRGLALVAGTAALHELVTG